MQPEERAYLLNLCERIAREQDRDKFTQLLQELEVALDSLHLTDQGPKTASR